MPLANRKPAAVESSASAGYTRIPRWIGPAFKSPGFIETLVGSVTPSCAVLLLLVQERTTGSTFGQKSPEAWTTTESELGSMMRMTGSGIRRLFREAEGCIHDDPDKAKRLGLLEVTQTRRGVELRFIPDHLGKLRPRREPKVLPTQKEREERKRVHALKAELQCPKGMDCPVDEVYVNGLVTNIAPVGALIVRDGLGEGAETTSAPLGRGRTLPANPAQTTTPVAGRNGKGATGVAPTNRHNKQGALSLERVQALQDALDPLLFDVLGKNLDGVFARKILDALGDNAPARFLQVVSLPPNLKRLRKEGARVLLYLAQDLAAGAESATVREQAARESREREQRQAEEQAKGPEGIALLRSLISDETFSPKSVNFLPTCEQILAHPLCTGQDRELVYRMCPGLQSPEPMFESGAD